VSRARQRPSTWENAGARFRVRSLELVVVRTRKGISMADVAYIALTIGIFGLLALILRGLEKLT
jgi:hypothetical protein